MFFVGIVTHTPLPELSGPGVAREGIGSACRTKGWVKFDLGIVNMAEFLVRISELLQRNDTYNSV